MDAVAAVYQLRMDAAVVGAAGHLARHAKHPQQSQVHAGIRKTAQAVKLGMVAGAAQCPAFILVVRSQYELWIAPMHEILAGPASHQPAPVTLVFFVHLGETDVLPG